MPCTIVVGTAGSDTTLDEDHARAELPVVGTKGVQLRLHGPVPSDVARRSGVDEPVVHPA